MKPIKAISKQTQLARYNVGDELVVSINEGTEGSPWWHQVRVLILGVGNGGDGNMYLCYVPCYDTVKGTFKINNTHQKYYKFDSKFLGEEGIFLTNESRITGHIPALPGATCERCKLFFQGANPEPGYRCWSCKQNPWR